MKIIVTAKPRAKQEFVEQVDATHFKVSVKEPPIGGRANEAVERALADYFDVAKSRVRVISGHAAKKKVVEIF